MIKMGYKKINEENGTIMEFDNRDELVEFLDDVFELNIDLLNDDYIRSNNIMIEVLVISKDDEVLIDYMK
jgi:hypothetical protein